MFQKFTDRARRVVVLAQHEARTLNHDHISTEHLLLALIDEGQGVAARALASMDVSLKEMRQAVQDRIRRGEHPVPESRQIGFTHRAKKVLELSLREAQHLGHDHIGTEHILLALLREGDGVAAQVLVASGLDLYRFRQQVIALQSGHGEAGAVAAFLPAAGDELLGRLTSIFSRLDAIEQRLSQPGTS